MTKEYMKFTGDNHAEVVYFTAGNIRPIPSVGGMKIILVPTPRGMIRLASGDFLIQCVDEIGRTVYYVSKKEVRK